jgi:phosphopantothenoylcysteine decarboxylase / phosphopantothenate---cysteine ligase
MKNRVLIGVGGGIAAYKVCDLVSALAKAGVEVRVIMTASAAQFISPLTLSTLARHPVYTDAEFWHAAQPRPLHIALGEWADVILLAPVTANRLAKLAHGFADDLLTNTILASTAPVLLAPAMNTVMWEQPVVQANWQTLLAQNRFHGVGPEAGILACDAVGPGRLASLDTLEAAVQSLRWTGGTRDFQGDTLLISAGGTREHWDPVRFIGNPATGKMGVALATAAVHRGGRVQLVVGPGVQVPSELAVDSESVVSADEMQTALKARFPQATITIMAAAVADVRPAQYSSQKQPKSMLPMVLELAPVPDLIQGLVASKQPHQRVIGFAAQSGEIVAPAQEKLMRKGLDAIVANPIDLPEAGFGGDRNQAVWLDRTGARVDLPLVDKLTLAHQILDLIRDLKSALD